MRTNVSCSLNRSNGRGRQRSDIINNHRGPPFTNTLTVLQNIEGAHMYRSLQLFASVAIGAVLSGCETFYSFPSSTPAATLVLVADARMAAKPTARI